MSGFTKGVQHILELILICTFFILFLLLPIKVASRLGGLIGRIIGFLLVRRNKIALINIKIAFPDKSDIEKHKTISNMWDNLGRILGEMPHWYFMSKTAILRMVKIEGVIPSEKQLILLTGHYGNWELISQFLPSIGLYSSSIYKSLNNKYIDYLLKVIRSAQGALLFTKNSGMKRAIKNLHQGGCLGLLIDQRFDNGIAIPFFNHPSQTLDLPARLSVQNKIPIYMIKMMRMEGIQYKAEFIKIKESQDSRQIMCEVNNVLESWIRDKPEQWFWIHRRWDKNLYK